MKVIYIAGKYGGKTHDGSSFAEISRNILVAREWAINVMKLGNCVALTPHLNSYHMELDFNPSQDFWYKADLELLERCDAVFFIPGWLDSKGARIENEFAVRKGIVTFENIDHLKEWLETV